MRRFSGGLLLMLAVILGCEELAPISNKTPNPSSSRSSAPPPDDSESVQEDVEYERHVAEVGAGKKGRNYGGGIVSEPIRQMFRAEQRIILLNVESAMKLYKAEHGKLPASHEDFMKKIIEANSIKLPELPDGERYVYDPKVGELMVERPRR